MTTETTETTDKGPVYEKSCGEQGCWDCVVRDGKAFAAWLKANGVPEGSLVSGLAIAAEAVQIVEKEVLPRFEALESFASEVGRMSGVEVTLVMGREVTTPDAILAALREKLGLVAHV